MAPHRFPVVRTEQEWRERLTPEQYIVMRRHGTEEPNSCALLHEKRAGTFACAGCDAALFESKLKFESGTGWPSFTGPIDPQHVLGIEDNSYGMRRIETRCARCDSHQGHVFPDGPRAAGGLRYCINSVSLQFVADGEALPDPLGRAERIAA